MANGSKVWFITGTSRGFGRVWANAALERGDRVVATARNTAGLGDLVARYGDSILTIALDVTDKAAVDAAVERAHWNFGRLDVVVNNAGYAVFGTIEEVSEEQARAQMETNLFGALWVTKAALPYMFEQGSGHIVQVSSVGGLIANPVLGMYHASKWALEAFSQSLAGEVADLGVKVTIVEPGGFATDWSGPSAVHAQPLSQYDGVRAARTAWAGSFAPGDPEATGAALLEVVDAKEPPLRIFLGKPGLDMVRAEYRRRLSTWEQWDAVSRAAQGDKIRVEVAV
jgi:NAD(P)-dependent dehydrogenase (short-subunit alcohol dehydrogenase family)